MSEPPQFSCLSDTAILHHIEQGNIIIEPFERDNLGTCSYDISLGEYFYAEHETKSWVNTFDPSAGSKVWNGPFKARLAIEMARECGYASVEGFGEGILPHDRLIGIMPGETILGHSEQFIGGRKCVTSMLKCRSSAGRHMLSICTDAGWGDTGYVNRYTLEITNRSQFHMMLLVVGRRYGQIIFFQTDPLVNDVQDYVSQGKYQSSSDLEELKRSWKPSSMLPRMHLDREARTVERIKRVKEIESIPSPSLSLNEPSDANREESECEQRDHSNELNLVQLRRRNQANQ
jgi:deoxycytidine triphosphate deaminase